jgi:hypothetical protein
LAFQEITVAVARKAAVISLLPRLPQQLQRRNNSLLGSLREADFTTQIRDVLAPFFG